MTEKYLINQDDIKLYRPTAELEDGRLNPYILEAQEIDLKPVLNPSLYLDFLKKFDVTGDAMYAAYQELLHGKEWTYQGATIFFTGVKPMLSYFSLSRFVQNNPVHISRFGIVTKTANQSEPVDPAVLRSVVNDLRSSAMSYQIEVIKFLTENTTAYPLYRNGESANANTHTSFNFMKL